MKSCRKVKLAYLTSLGLENWKKKTQFQLNSEMKYLSFYKNKQVFVHLQATGSNEVMMSIINLTLWISYLVEVSWSTGDVEFCVLSVQLLICSGLEMLKYLQSKTKSITLKFCSYSANGALMRKSSRSQSLPHDSHWTLLSYCLFVTSERKKCNHCTVIQIIYLLHYHNNNLKLNQASDCDCWALHSWPQSLS